MAGMAAAVAAVAVAGLLTIAGCGGGGDDDGAAAATGPVAAVQDDHLPVDPIETIPDRLDMIAETGATTTRVDLFWSAIAGSRPAEPTDPSDPAYDFARADLIMFGLAERGITPIVSVYNTPVWASDGPPPTPGVAVNTAAPDPAAFGDFMEAVAARYSGAVTSPGGERLPEVRHFELWNEPNLPGFLTPQFEDGEPVALETYAAMAEDAYPKIKRANRDAIVIAGVAGPRSSTSETGTGALDWLTGLRDREIPLDAYSQHVYPAAPPQETTDAVPSWSSVDLLLRELDGFRPGLPLYITEAGYTTAATPFRKVKVTEEEQAEYLTQIFALPQLQDPRVAAVVWFNLQDNPNWPAGLLRGDLARKPSYERFREVAGAQGGRTLTG